MSKLRILLLIAAFITLTLGSFIWYIITWDPDTRTEGSGDSAPIFILAQKLPPEAPTPTTGAAA